MTAAPSLTGRWALITGASSGLGVEFAHALARRGANAILVARREERLRETAEALEEQHGVRTIVRPADLSEESARTGLLADLDTHGEVAGIDLLVNNAGFGIHGPFHAAAWPRERAQLEIDVVALTHLTKLVLPGMLDRGFGRILQVASIGAYQPSPTYASYSAAKAYVLRLGQALHYELRGTGVSCTVVSPGPARTEFLDVAGQQPTLYQRLTMMDADRVAEVGVRALLRGRSSVVPGWLNAVTAWTQRFLPTRLAAAIAHRAMTLG